MKLSDEQVMFFRERGYLIAPNIMTHADLQPVIDEAAAVIDAKARKLHEEGKIADLGESLGFERRFVHLFNQCRDINNNFDVMIYQGKAIFEFFRNTNLLDAIESLIGPEITCNPIQHIRALPPTDMTGATPNYFFRTPWHQDSGVTWEEADFSDIVTCWIPLVNATKINGCMQVMPDVFKQGHLDHVAEGGTTIDPVLLPDAPFVDAECPRGGAVLMSKFTPHRTGVNSTDTARWSLDLRFQPTGQPTGRPFHPAFVVRSKANPGSVLTDHAEWCRLWNHAFANPPTRGGHRTKPPRQRPAVKA